MFKGYSLSILPCKRIKEVIFILLRQVQNALKEEYNKKIKSKSTFKFAYGNQENPNMIPKAYRPNKGSLKDPTRGDNNISQLNPNHIVLTNNKRKSDDTSKNKMLNLSQNLLSHFSELDQQNKSLNLILEK